MKPYLLDVPVKINIWIRPECQRKQFDIIRQVRPSIIFLQSDGGRNDKEWKAIHQNRQLIDKGIDWECTIYRFYEDHNNGLYTMGKKVSDFIWAKVDRCIFLEDDYIPAISFFFFCAELLERYKDDERIEMICGNNPFEQYLAAEPYDYFFTENGWSIWGTACWKRTVANREYPFDYMDSQYIKRCLNDNATWFWRKKINNYCNGRLDDNHVPGSEYYHAANSILFHRLSIVPTRNMIQNIGFEGEHFSAQNRGKNNALNIPVYELDGPIRHPKYVVDDKYYSGMYEKLLHHSKPNGLVLFIRRTIHFIKLLFTGKAIDAIKRKMNPEIEK